MPATTVTPEATITATPPATATPRPTATHTPTPTPTPLSPGVQALQQQVGEARSVVISSITMPEAGWIAIYSDDEGEAGTIIGYSPVPPGNSRDIRVEIDPFAVTPILHARLHEDTGERDVFDFPNADPPLSGENGAVEDNFRVTLELLLPSVTVEDQQIDARGQVTVAAATVPEDGWVALHAAQDGAPGPILGQTPLQAGESENVVITFDRNRATRQLFTLLYQDGGIPGRFEPGSADRLYLYQGMPISATFTATLPVDVFVINQPAGTGVVVIDRVVTNRQGWVAVYSDFSGFADRLLGYVPIPPGASEMITIPVESQGITPILHVTVHDDVGVEGEFEHLGPDLPVRDDSRMLLFSFQTNAGNYLITLDQRADTEVVVPLVVADLDVWLAIQRPDDAGEPGEMLGFVPLSPGIHRDVVVPVEGAAPGETLLAVLYRDVGEAGTFEYPDGPDLPLRFERAFVRAPFTLVTNDN